MPIRSKAQQRLMFAAAAGKAKNVSAKVAKEYIAATPSSSYKDLPDKAKKQLVLRKKKP